MPSLLKPRLRPEIGNITLPDGSTTTQGFRLARRLRRADPSTRLMIEAHEVVSGDLKQRADQWNAADSLTGLRVRADQGLELADASTTVITNTLQDGYITDLNTTSPFIVCRVEWGDGLDTFFQLRRVTVFLDPANGGAKNVATWRCTLMAAIRVYAGATPLIELVPMAAAVDVAAGVSAAEVTFNFLEHIIRPKAVGAPGDGGTTLPRATMYVFISALKSDGSPATNVGWQRDSAQSLKTTSGTTIQARELTLQGIGVYGGTYADADSAANGVPYITIDKGGGYIAATVSFTGANKPDLGAVPASASVVEFTVQGEVPVGATITGQARVGGADAWVTFRDGQTATDIGLAASQTYQMRATLTPPASGDVTPILVTLGVREVTRTDLSHIATAEGGGWGFDPPTLKGSIPEVTITAIQDGERDFRDTITTLLSGTHIGDFWFRIFVGSDDTPRDAWYPIDDFYPDHVEGRGGAMVIRAVNVLGILRAVLPKYDVATEAREVLSYANQTLKAAFNDVQAGQLAVPGRHIGAQIEDTTTLVTKRIEDSDGKIELDSLAFLAGGTVLGRQGRMDFVDVHGEKGVAAIFGVEDIAQETVTPGWSQRVPEYFVDWGYDPDTREWDGQHRGFNSLAYTKLGRTFMDPPTFLDEEIAKWIPTQALAQTVTKRQIETLGTGMITVSFRTQYPHPELWPGDLVAVRTDRLVARSPTDDREIKGYLWVLGVISQRADLWGTRFTVWVRKYSDIIATSNAVTVEATPDPIFTGASYTTEAGPAPGSVAAYAYRNTVQSLPNGLWRTALYDDDVWHLQKNTAVAGDFSSLSDYLTISAAGLVALRAGATISGNELKAEAGVRSEAAAPYYSWRETDQTLPLGLWRARLQGNVFLIERNTAAGGDFSSLTTPFQINASDQVMLSALLTAQAGLTVSGGSISASGIAATVGALTASGVAASSTEAVSAGELHGVLLRLTPATGSAVPIDARSSGASAGIVVFQSMHNDYSNIVQLLSLSPGAASFGSIPVSMGALTATGVLVTGTNPEFDMTRTGSAVDEKNWDTVLAATTINFRAVNDANTAANIWLTVTRSGYGISSASFGSVPVSMGALTATTVTGTGLFQTTVTTQQLSLRYDASNHLAVTVGIDGAVTYNATGSGALHTFSDDVTIGSLGRFDSTDTPTDLQLLVYHSSLAKWQAESIQFLYQAGDTAVGLLADNTSVAYISYDPGAGADSPVGAPPAPVLALAQEHKAITVVAYSGADTPNRLYHDGSTYPADFRYCLYEYSLNGVDWSALATASSDRVVHGRLTAGTTYYYRAKARDRAGNDSAYSSTVSVAAVANSKLTAFGSMVANEGAFANLAALSANIGIAATGQIRETMSSPASVINFGGVGGIPSTAISVINFENTAIPTGSKMILDFYRRLITVKDQQGTPQTRVEIGDIDAGGGSDWGIKLKGSSGAEVFRSYGAVDRILIKELRVGTITSDQGYVGLGSTGNPTIDFIRASGVTGGAIRSTAANSLEVLNADLSITKLIATDYHTITIGTSFTESATPKALLARTASTAASGAVIGGVFETRTTVATTGSMQGVEGIARASHGSGTVALLIGVPGNVFLDTAGGTTTWARAIQGGGSLTAGTVQNYASIYAANTASGASVTTAYGVYVDSITVATTNYAIYTAGSTNSRLGNLEVYNSSAFGGSGLRALTTNYAIELLSGHSADWAALKGYSFGGSDDNPTLGIFFETNVSVMSSPTLRFYFRHDGNAYADVAWLTFSPKSPKDELAMSARDWLSWAAEDARKPLKPYEGLPDSTHREVRRLASLRGVTYAEAANQEVANYAKDPAKIAIGTARWALAVMDMLERAATFDEFKTMVLVA